VLVRGGVFRQDSREEIAEEIRMVRLYVATERLWKNVSGQDMIEYALLAGAIAVVVAGFLPVNLMPSVSSIFSKVVSGFNAS
jgi:Flp pilus assembly pilin Flp